MGSVVAEFNSEENETSFRTDQLASGIYILQVTALNGQTDTRKFIVQ
jgi:hypothetical protein